MATQRAIVSRNGFNSQILNADTLLVGAGIDAPIAQALAVGAVNGSALNLSKVGTLTTVLGDFQANGTSTFTGASTFNGNVTFNGTVSPSEAVLLQPGSNAAQITAARRTAFAAGKPLVWLAGAYTWDTPNQLTTALGAPLNGLREILQAGVTITSTLPASGTELNAPFNYNVPGTATGVTLTVQGDPGANTLTVSNGALAEFTPGRYIELTRGPAGLTVRRYRIVNRVGNVLTIDRPLLRTWAIAGTSILAVVPLVDYQLLGNFAIVTGTGDRAVELVGVWQCRVKQLRIVGGGFQDFQCGYDLGCYDVVFEDIDSDAANFAFAAITMENTEFGVVRNCKGYRAAVQGGLFLPTCDHVTVEGGEYALNTIGINLGANDALTTAGCIGVTMDNVAVSKNTSIGIAIRDGAIDTTLSNITSEDNTQQGIYIGTAGATGVTVSSRTKISNYTHERGGFGITVENGSTNNEAYGVFTHNCSNNHIQVLSAASLIFQGTCRNDINLGAMAFLFSSGAGSRLIAKANVFSNDSAGANVQCSQNSAGGYLDISGLYDKATAGGFGNNNLGGFCDMHDFTNSGINSLSLVAGATANTLIGVAVSPGTSATPFNNAGGGLYNRGINGNVNIPGITLNGATPVAVAWPQMRAFDDVIINTVVLGGTPSPRNYLIVKTVGVGFTIAGVALDTSLLDFAIL